MREMTNVGGAVANSTQTISPADGTTPIADERPLAASREALAHLSRIEMAAQQ